MLRRVRIFPVLPRVIPKNGSRGTITRLNLDATSHLCYRCLFLLLAPKRLGSSTGEGRMNAVAAHFRTEHRRPTRLTELRFSNSEPSAVRSSNRGPLGSNLQRLTGVPETLRVLGRLIGTPERLETRVSHRKQTVATPSNRYTSHLADTLPFIYRDARGRALSHPREAFASHRSLLTSHHSSPPTRGPRCAPRVGVESTRDSRTSRIRRKSLKTNDRAPVYPRRFLTRRSRSRAANFSPEGQQSATIRRANLRKPGS